MYKGERFNSISHIIGAVADGGRFVPHRSGRCAIIQVISWKDPTCRSGFSLTFSFLI